MFKNIEELREYVEEECVLIVNEPDCCHLCGGILKDDYGYDQYYLCEDFPDEKFCSEECLVEYLISMGYLEKDE